MQRVAHQFIRGRVKSRVFVQAEAHGRRKAEIHHKVGGAPRVPRGGRLARCEKDRVVSFEF